MSVRFGSDGTVYCNTVKYNYKQCRNMIADGCYGNISNGTSSNRYVWQNLVSSNIVTSPSGYKSYRAFKLWSSASWIQQKLPNMYKSHVYYMSCMYKKNFNNYSTIGIKYDNIDKHILPASQSTNNNWVKASMIFSPEKDILSDTNDIEFIMWADGSIASTTSPLYVSRIILVDLTYDFGAGNEPSKEWCDNNIREHETIINYGSTSTNVNNSNYSSRYTGRQIKSKGSWGYLALDSWWEPREYMYMLTSDSAKAEAMLYCSVNPALDNTEMYYAQIEYHRPYAIFSISDQSIDFYFPEEEPSLGSVAIVNTGEFNKGGGMLEWKRASAFGTRAQWANGNYTFRIDFNNNYRETEFRCTAIELLRVQSNVTQYNNYNGTSITLADVNKEWCDRWIDGRSSPIIHIKDPANTKILFNTNYDIVCNDIEIRPELNKVIMDNTGTIKCKKLVRVQAY